jgi:hypothetical protein
MMAEAGVEYVSSVMGICLAFKMPKVEGWGSDGLILSFYLKKAGSAAWKAFILFSFKILVWHCVACKTLLDTFELPR